MLTSIKSFIKQNELKKALVLALELLEKYPQHAEVNYQTTSIYDARGEERLAIPLYENALRQNIEGDERAAAFIQLGSSYRCIGKYEKAKQVLLQGLEEYPNNLAMQAFLAITMYNMNQGNSAVSILVKVLSESANDPWVKKYQKALQFYSEHLDEVW